MQTMKAMRDEAKQIEEAVLVDIRRDLAEASPVERACLARALSEMFEGLMVDMEQAHFDAVREAYPDRCDPQGHFDAEHDS